MNMNMNMNMNNKREELDVFNRWNMILNRNECVEKMRNALETFQKNKADLLQTRGIYIYGKSGVGKSYFVKMVLNQMNYDIIQYDAGDIRNKAVIDNITKLNMSDKNVLSMFYKNIKPIVIVMDEIDGMNGGDKGGINALIKLIRPKKTKKQKTEEMTFTPIICIGNDMMDKKMKELLKVCVPIELKVPSPSQMKQLIQSLFPLRDTQFIDDVMNYINGDLRKLQSFYAMTNMNGDTYIETWKHMMHSKIQVKDTKEITKQLLYNPLLINEHLDKINETDRTIVGLLWHENIIDGVDKLPIDKGFELYNTILDKMSYADYMDRITFQRQIWIFNEMSSLMKTCHTNQIYHETIQQTKSSNTSNDIRFTKVLTKYSTEYNNSVFIQSLCQRLGLDKKDVFIYFNNLREKYRDDEIIKLLDPHEIYKLDVHRMYRFIDAYVKETNEINTEIDIDLDEEGNVKIE
jgi:hypothetical protein